MLTVLKIPAWNPMSWNAPWVVIAAALAVLVTFRSTVIYSLGRGIVAGTAHSRWSGLLDTRVYRMGSAWLNRWGAPAVTLCFLTIGVQTAVLISAGISRMPLRKFYLALIPGAIIWGMIYATVGVVGFIGLKALWDFSPPLMIGLVLIALIIATLFIRQARAKQAAKTSQLATAAK